MHEAWARLEGGRTRARRRDNGVSGLTTAGGRKGYETAMLRSVGCGN